MGRVGCFRTPRRFGGRIGELLSDPGTLRRSVLSGEVSPDGVVSLVVWHHRLGRSMRVDMPYLHFCTLFGRHSLVAELVDLGADVRRTCLGMGALWFAVLSDLGDRAFKHGDTVVRIVRCLVKSGCTPMERSELPGGLSLSEAVSFGLDVWTLFFSEWLSSVFGNEWYAVASSVSLSRDAPWRLNFGGERRCGRAFVLDQAMEFWRLRERETGIDADLARKEISIRGNGGDCR